VAPPGGSRFAFRSQLKFGLAIYICIYSMFMAAIYILFLFGQLSRSPNRLPLGGCTSVFIVTAALTFVSATQRSRLCNTSCRRSKLRKLCKPRQLVLYLLIVPQLQPQSQSQAQAQAQFKFQYFCAL